MFGCPKAGGGILLTGLLDLRDLFYRGPAQRWAGEIAEIFIWLFPSFVLFSVRKDVSVSAGDVKRLHEVTERICVAEIESFV